MYNIVIVINDKYVQHALVMLASLYATNPHKSFSVYVITDGLSEDKVALLQNSCASWSMSLIVLIPNSQMEAGLNALPTGCWNKMIYYKLFIPQLLPYDIDRCLFLDVDMIINDDISSLYDRCFDTNTDHDASPVICACEDVPPCEQRKQQIGLPATVCYINSGVMLCNLIEWRKMEKERPILQFTKSVSDRIINEQDVIALYFQGRIQLLPIRWNMVTFYFYRSPLIYDKYLPELKKAKQQPGIIHFCSPIKPWFRDCDHPYGKLYRKYTKKTPYKDYVFPYHDKVSTYKRIKRWIYQIYIHITRNPGELVK